jgi:hypothetical protein
MGLESEALRIDPEEGARWVGAAACRRPPLEDQVAVRRGLDSVVGGVLVGVL